MSRAPRTVEEYLRALPADRRDAIARVRGAVLAGLPEGYAEGIQYGMIGWFVPHDVYAAGYHVDPTQPLPFASLASQKAYMSLYLMCVYSDASHRAWFEAECGRRGAKVDLGKSCVRFKRLEDLPLGLVTEAVARVPVEAFIASYEAARGARGGGRKKKLPIVSEASNAKASKVNAKVSKASKASNAKRAAGPPSKGVPAQRLRKDAEARRKRP